MIGKIKHPFMHKVLPLIYDNSLSYYEVLNKLIAKLNEIIEAIDTDFESIVSARLEEIFAECTYNEETETISISLIDKED